MHPSPIPAYGAETAQSSFGSAPTADPEIHEDDPVTQVQPTTWRQMFDMYHSPRASGPENDHPYTSHYADFDISKWIRDCWETNEHKLISSQVNTIAAAFAQVKVGEAVFVRYDSNGDTRLPIPAAWGDRTIDGNPFIYHHGTSHLILRSIRRWGLLGTSGTRSEEMGPCVYTCEQRHVPFTYSGDDEGYELIVNNPNFPRSQRYVRKFKCLIGVCPLMPWPWHSNARTRTSTSFPAALVALCGLNWCV